MGEYASSQRERNGITVAGRGVSILGFNYRDRLDKANIISEHMLPSTYLEYVEYVYNRQFAFSCMSVLSSFFLLL